MVCRSHVHHCPVCNQIIKDKPGISACQLVCCDECDPMEAMVLNMERVAGKMREVLLGKSSPESNPPERNPQI